MLLITFDDKEFGIKLVMEKEKHGRHKLGLSKEKIKYEFFFSFCFSLEEIKICLRCSQQRSLQILKCE